MRHSRNLASAFVAASCMSSVLAMPAPRPQVTYYSDPADVPTGSISVAGPPQATGNVRGGSYLVGWSAANPVDTTTGNVPESAIELGLNQAADADLGLFIDLSDVEVPQPIRGSTTESTDPGPQNYEYEKLNSDLYAPPTSDSGSVPNVHWPLGLSHNRLGTPGTAGWSRQQNTEQIPIATAMAGVDMRLSPNAYRELHWHQANEWSLVLNGSVRLSAVNDEGQTFIDDLQAGDVWFFPAGMPHSIQALENGCEFLLIFDQGTFSDSDTSLVSELFLRNPREVLAKNFQTDVSSFDNLPSDQLYIFPGTQAPTNISEQNVTGPNGIIPTALTYSYHFSQQLPYEVPGGTVKILDSESFPISSNFAAALFTIEPGAMRELHWHTTSDEWNYFIQGQARLTVYDAPTSSATFDFVAGDVGYISATQAHYVENTGTETVIYLEMLQAPRYNDISVGQWLGLTSQQIVGDTLHLPQSVLDNLPKYKQYIVPGNPNISTTNFTAPTS